MPLKFSDIASFVNGYTPHFNTPTTDSGFSDMMRQKAQLRAQAAENEKNRKADVDAATMKSQSDIAMKQAGLKADIDKETREAKRKFMEKVGAAVKSGDEEAIRSLAYEAPQYGLSIDEKTGATKDKSAMSELELAEDDASKGPDSSLSSFTINENGQLTPLDVGGAKQRNQQRAKDIYGAVGRNARPEDVAATKQAFDMAIAMGMPPEEALKLAQPESMAQRLQRETSERNAQRSLAERRAEQGIALGQRADEHEDRMGLSREAMALKGQEAANRDAARDSVDANRWSESARKLNKDLGVQGRRDVSQSGGKILKLLESQPIIPGAQPGKAQAVAVGEMAAMAQAGDRRISDKDRAAMEREWDIIGSIGAVISKGATGELTEQQVKNFNEAVARVIIYNNEKQKEAMEDMAVAKMNLPPSGADQFDRYINIYFGDEPWFKDEAKRLGVTEFPLRTKTPMPSSGQPSMEEPAPTDDEFLDAAGKEGF